MESAPPRRGRPRSSPRTLFSQRFAELFAAAGNPTLRRVAAAADARMRATRGPGQKSPVSVQRLSDWKAGRNVPARFESLLPVLLTLIDEARKSSGPVTPSLLDLHQWQQLWTASNDWDPNSEAADVVCPYLGLASYRSEDADVFFGRARHTADLVGLIRTTAEGDGGLVVLVGASGAGKSSLLHAGVLPALTDSDPAWAIATMTPGPDPMRALLSAVHSEGGTPGDPDIADVVGSVPDAVAEWASAGRRILVVDQLEELFTLCREERQRAEFLAVLEHLAAGNEHGPVAVVAAIRADFYARCLDEPVLEDALKHRSYLLGPMRLDELADAITRPADIAGYKLESGLEELVISELCGLGGGGDRRSYDPGALPLVSHVMEAVWERRDGSRLTIEGYRAAGGVLGSVAATAEQAWNELTDFQRAVGKQVLLGLVAVGDDSRDTRRKVSRAELLTRTVEAADAALDALARTRLITLDAETAYLTHEIVLDAWPRLRSWIDDDRVGYLERQRLHTDAADWSEHDRDPSLLYRGARLTTMRDHARDAALGPVAAEFLAASESARKRAQRRVTARRSALAVLTVVSLALAGVAFVQSHNASHERDNAVFRSVLAEADRVEGSDPSLSAQLDLVAYRMRPTDPEVDTRLINTQAMPLAAQLSGHTGMVFGVALGIEKPVMATADYDKTVRLWDISDRTNPHPLGRPITGLSEYARTLAFDPAGNVLAAQSVDGTVRLWDVRDPHHPVAIGEPIESGFGLGLAFAPDGKTLLMAGKEGTDLPKESRGIVALDLSDEQHPFVARSLIPAPADRDNWYGTVRFSADTRRIVTMSARGLARTWQLDDPRRPAQLQAEFATDARVIELSPDGRIAAAVSKGAVHFWDLADPRNPRPANTPVPGSDLPVDAALGFSRDGKLFAGDNGKGVVRLWDITDIDHPVPAGPPLSGARGFTGAIAFTSDGRNVATVGQDTTVRLWTLPPARGQNWPRGRVLAASGRIVVVQNGATTQVWSIDTPDTARHVGDIDVRSDSFYGSSWVVTSPDDRKLLIMHQFQRPELYGLGNGELRPLGAVPVEVDMSRNSSSGAYRAAAFDADSDLLAIAADQQPSPWWQLWDLSDPAHPVQRKGQVPTAGSRSTMRDIAFTADGKHLATVSDDNTATVWTISADAHPRAIATLVVGHGESGRHIAFSPDGRTLAVTGDDQKIRVWDIANPAAPEPIGDPLTGHRSMIASLAFAPDGKSLVSADGTEIRLWDFTDPRRPSGADHSEISAGEVMSDRVAFYPDGKHLVGATADGTVHVWDLDPEHAVDRICSTTKSVLTEEVWREHLPQLKYRPPCE